MIKVIESKDIELFTDLYIKTYILNLSNYDQAYYYLKTKLNPDESIGLIAYENEIPVGYLIANIFHFDDFKYAKLDEIGVVFSSRNKLIGSSLISFMEKILKVKKCRSVYLECYKNTEIINFYKKNSFSVVNDKIFMNKYL